MPARRVVAVRRVPPERPLALGGLPIHCRRPDICLLWVSALKVTSADALLEYRPCVHEDPLRPLRQVHGARLLRALGRVGLQRLPGPVGLHLLDRKARTLARSGLTSTWSFDAPLLTLAFASDAVRSVTEAAEDSPAALRATTPTWYASSFARR